jgi:uncharacterized protein
MRARGAADPNAATELGLTPLHYATILGRHDLAQALLAAGADASSADKHGRTPLDWARLKGLEELVLLLRARQYGRISSP